MRLIVRLVVLAAMGWFIAAAVLSFRAGLHAGFSAKRSPEARWAEEHPDDVERLTAAIGVPRSAPGLGRPDALEWDIEGLTDTEIVALCERVQSTPPDGWTVADGCWTLSRGTWVTAITADTTYGGYGWWPFDTPATPLALDTTLTVSADGGLHVSITSDRL